MNRIVKRLAVPLSAAAVLGTAGFAYMAHNSIDTTYAGQMTGTVDAYNVSSVHFDHSGNKINFVQFKLDQEAAVGQVRAWVVNGTGAGTTWPVYGNCSAVGPDGVTQYTSGQEVPAYTLWTCTPSSAASVASTYGVSGLKISASQ